MSVRESYDAVCGYVSERLLLGSQAISGAPDSPLDPRCVLAKYFRMENIIPSAPLWTPATEALLDAGKNCGYVPLEFCPGIPFDPKVVFILKHDATHRLERPVLLLEDTVRDEFLNSNGMVLDFGINAVVKDVILQEKSSEESCLFILEYLEKQTPCPAQRKCFPWAGSWQLLKQYGVRVAFSEPLFRETDNLLSMDANLPLFVEQEAFPERSTPEFRRAWRALCGNAMAYLKSAVTAVCDASDSMQTNSGRMVVFMYDAAWKFVPLIRKTDEWKRLEKKQYVAFLPQTLIQSSEPSE